MYGFVRCAGPASLVGHIAEDFNLSANYSYCVSGGDEMNEAPP